MINLTSVSEGMIPRCPNCNKPLPEDWVYRAGFEMNNFRVYPPVYGRGQYCDHIPREQACGS